MLSEERIALEELRKTVLEETERRGRPLTACVVTFGCQMNERDSEKLRGILLAAGFEGSESEEADVVIFNTCTVRENANTRLYGHLGHLNSMKREHPDKIKFTQENLKELIGHTPLQVLIGALFGIAMGFATYPLFH